MLVFLIHELQTTADHLAGDSDGNIFQIFPFSHIAELRSALNTFTPENVLLHGLAEGDAWIKYA